jgi:dihydrofolate reductase
MPARKGAIMRKIVAGMFITLDGVVEAPQKWNPAYYNQEMTEAVQAQLAAADTHLYGRRSYELFRSVFTGPAADTIPHAEMMNNSPKIVVSTTLENPDWGPTTLITSNVAAELTKLKQQPGKNINVGGSRLGDDRRRERSTPQTVAPRSARNRATCPGPQPRSQINPSVRRAISSRSARSSGFPSSSFEMRAAYSRATVS